MSSTSADVSKRCENCLESVKVHLTCFKCDATYHVYCWQKMPGAYVNKRGQLFCCSSLTSNYATANTNLEAQDNLPEKVIEKGNIDGYNEDLMDCPIKQEDSEWSELKCDACHLEFTNKEHLENHYSECPNRERGFIQEFIKVDKDLMNCPIKQEDSEWNEFKCDVYHSEFTNREHLENHYSECPNEGGEFIHELKEDKDLGNSLHKEEDLEWSEFRCGACLLDFTNKEHLKNHYSECSNKEGVFTQELKEDKDLENLLPKEENSEPDEKRMENHCSQCPNKQEGSIPGLNKDRAGLFCSFCNEENFQTVSYEQHVKHCQLESSYSRFNKDNDTCISNTKRTPSQVDDEEEKYKRTICNYSTHVEGCVVKGIRIHSSGKSFKCDMCDYTAKESETLKSHFSSKHYDIKEKCDSRVCTFSTPSKRDGFGSHRQVHTTERLFKSDLCGDYTAAQGINVNINIKSKHSNTDKKYKCRDCEYSTYRKVHLTRHIRTHTNEKPFKCDMCDYAAARRGLLNGHILAKHSNADKEYKCKDCEYSTHSKAQLIRHIHTHTNERLFKCGMCDYAGARKETLNNHILSKHSNADKRYKCKDCEYSTHTKAKLVNHIRTHTNEKPFKCDTCDYAAAQKGPLTVHILAKHSNADKNYKCKDCEYSSHVKRNLVRHTRTHTNEKPFKCDQCDYAAALKQVLKGHILVKHSNAARV